MEPKIRVFLLVLLMSMTPGVCRGNPHAVRLTRDLFSMYSTRLAPTHSLDDEPVQVTVGIQGLAVSNVDGTKQSMDAAALIQIQWQDAAAQWDPSRYGGVTNLTLPASDLWLPDLVLLHNLLQGSPQTSLGQSGGKLRLRHDGLVEWRPSVHTSTSCHVDVLFYPFDIQHCKLCMSTAVSTRQEVNLTFDPSNDPLLLQAVQTGDGGGGRGGGLWEVAGSNTSLVHDHESLSSVVCSTLTLRRRVTFAAVLHSVLPALCLCMAAYAVTSLPAEGGVKVVTSTASLLALWVYLGAIRADMPHPSNQVSLLDVYHLLLLLVTMVGIVVSTLVYKTHSTPNRLPVKESTRRTVRSLQNMLKMDQRRPASSTAACGDVSETPDKPDQSAPNLEEESEITWQLVAEVMDRTWFILFEAGILFLTVSLALAWTISRALS